MDTWKILLFESKFLDKIRWTNDSTALLSYTAYTATYTHFEDASMAIKIKKQLPSIWIWNESRINPLFNSEWKTDVFESRFLSLASIYIEKYLWIDFFRNSNHLQDNDVHLQK